MRAALFLSLTYCLLTTVYCLLPHSEAAAEEVGGFDEEVARVAAEALFGLAREGVEVAAVEVVVVADVEGRAGVRRPAEEELPEVVRPERAVVEPRAREGVARELVGRLKAVDVRVEGDQPVLVPDQTVLRPAQRHVERVRSLVSDSAVGVEQVALAGVERARAHGRRDEAVLLAVAEPVVGGRARR